MILMFLSPVFYPVSALPMDYQSMIYMNPLVFIIEQVRNVLYWGVGANFIGLAFYIFGSMIVAFVGFFWFQKTRSGFADVL
jgi:lipopolysaccharide transport system permease protein